MKKPFIVAVSLPFFPPPSSFFIIFPLYVFTVSVRLILDDGCGRSIDVSARYMLFTLVYHMYGGRYFIMSENLIEIPLKAFLYVILCI